MSDNINNVLMYVADSVRYDYFPEHYLSTGNLYKTVAQSHTTWPVMATLATGLRPQQHGVQTYTDRICDEIPTVYNLDGLNTSLYGTESNIEHLLEMLRAENRVQLENLEPPFFYFEQDNTPHMPYAKGWGKDAAGYYSSRLSDPYHLKQDYQESIRRSLKKFQRRIDCLDRRGLLEETLVIFTSDHGELLGEYGCYGHNAPACPELTYVPTVFSHRSLTTADFGPDTDSDVIEHVDIVETIVDVLGESAFQTMGENVLAGDWSSKPGYSYKHAQQNDRTYYEAEGLWWHDGGYTFIRNSKLSRLLYVLYMFTRSSVKEHMRRNTWNVIETFLADGHTFGSPPLSRSEASEVIDTITDELEHRMGETLSLDKEQQERLENLGYWM